MYFHMLWATVFQPVAGWIANCDIMKSEDSECQNPSRRCCYCCCCRVLYKEQRAKYFSLFVIICRRLSITLFWAIRWRRCNSTSFATRDSVVRKKKQTMRHLSRKERRNWDGLTVDTITYHFTYLFDIRLQAHFDIYSTYLIYYYYLYSVFNVLRHHLI